MRRRLGLAAVEGAQRRQSADDVEEVPGEKRERLPPLARAMLRVPADQPHEDRHERKRQQHDPGRKRVEERNQDEHRSRHDEGEDDLRQVAGEGRLERVHPADRRRCGLGARGPVERRGVVPEPPLDELEPQAGEDVARGAPAHDLESPGRPGTRRDDGEEERQRRGDVPERSTREGPRSHLGEQHRLGEHEQRGDEPESRIDREHRPDGPRTTTKARIENAHR